MKKKHAILLLKILFIACALSFVFYKADSGKIFGYLKNISPAVALASLLALGAAQVAGIEQETGIALALLYFFVNLLCSLNGLAFWSRLKGMYG